VFEKILVANRGEIARRIFRTCRELDIRTVAIYSEVDKSAPWARQADESYMLPGVAARDTYLNQELIFEIAAASGVDAIHPGYGFLSENPEFVDACAARGLSFVGPTAAAMRALGSKATARTIAGQAGVPVVPGLDAATHTDEELKAASAELGYPVLIKASAGGGGKGMRVIENESEFDDALRAARGESLSSFGSDHVLVEKYHKDIRHIEIQVLGDRHGNLLHLFERECSLQRRHQKIVEECPSPAVTSAVRERLADAALVLARAVNYVNAGTLEFILTPDGEFYFLEMNTRLQVEHPVTELVAGVDMVELQLRIAAGQPLGMQQSALSMRGHSIECRIYAEDPASDFMPSTGEIAFYRPASGPGVRIDDGIEAGTLVSPYYDPMLVKVVVWGVDRQDAIRKMTRALQDTVILGVTTNIPYLLDVVNHPEFLEGRLSTMFLEERFNSWRPKIDTTRSTWLALAAFEEQSGVQSTDARGAAEAMAEHVGPWNRDDNWRNVA
jgi:3-methylcrotonyl-CoA carboxylase alpha subunit